MAQRAGATVRRQQQWTHFMGVALPSAIGAAIALERLPVFCMMGDGGYLDYFAEIKLAVQESLPICFILAADGRYGSIVGTSGVITKVRAVTIAQPSWWKAAESIGCRAVSAQCENEFIHAISTWDHTTPLFVETVFEPMGYAAMTEGLR